MVAWSFGMQAVVISDALRNLRVGIQNEALTTIYRITVFSIFLLLLRNIYLECC